MAIVNASPSISISRRIVLSSLVAMGYDVIHGSGGLVRRKRPGAMPLLSSGKHIVYEPLSLVLTNNRLPDHSALLEHIVSRLKHALQM